MEPYSQRKSREDLQTSRSRTSSHISVGESSFRALDIRDSAVVGAQPPFSIGINQALGTVQLSPPNFNPSPQQSPPLLATSSPPIHVPLSLPSQNNHLQDWTFIDPVHSSETPILRLEQPQDHLDLSAVRAGYTSEPESCNQSDMSAMGVQYYPRYDASMHRASFTWPGFDQTVNFPDQISGLLGSLTEQPLIPSYSRSISSSPPRGSFLAEQPESKRQTDHTRRDSKARFRRERSSSNSYNPSLSTTPDIIPRSIGNYPQPMTAASNTSTVNLPMQPFMSPPLARTTQSPEFYHAQYPMVNNDFSDGYIMPFSSAPGESSIPAFPSRPLSMSSMSSAPDLQFYYRNPPISATQELPDTVRVVHYRPKPQCWEHGCNGRQFSTFSNLLRHQREKSGVASKPTCPKCGAEFTRTTARNGHMAHEKCKQRRNS